MTASSSGHAAARKAAVVVEAVEVAVEVVAGVLPAERFGCLVVAVLEGEDPLREVIEFGESPVAIATRCKIE